MDYPLHYTENNLQENVSGANHTQSNYRSYEVFNNPSIMFDNNNTSSSPTLDSLEATEDRSRSLMLMSTRPPPQVMHDPWTQHQLINANDFNPNDIHTLHHHHMSQSERGIAGFVSKLYQCLQSIDTSQKYARWCQHDGKDMFIIDCIPEFTEEVLPRLFKHCKFPSFVRQLNIYGFQRDTDARKSKDTKDKESCRWYHPCFRPGRRDLFHLIRRKATRYSRKKRVKTEEDPETILNLGSGDESEIEEALVIENEQTNDRRFSSSASPVNQSMQPIDYNSTSSQLQLGFVEQQQSTINSPNVLLVEATPIESDNADNLITQDVMMREEELRLQIFHMKRQYERMHGHFEEQLSTAHIQIEEQRLRIQQLEGVIRLTKQSPTYMPFNNNGNYVSSSSRLVTQHRPLYELQKNESTTPRPEHDYRNQFYFNDKIKTENNDNHDHLLHTPPPPRPVSPHATWNAFNHRGKFVAAGSNNHTENTNIIENDKTSRKPSQMNFNSYM